MFKFAASPVFMQQTPQSGVPTITPPARPAAARAPKRLSDFLAEWEAATPAMRRSFNDDIRSFMISTGTLINHNQPVAATAANPAPPARPAARPVEQSRHDELVAQWRAASPEVRQSFDDDVLRFLAEHGAWDKA